MTEECDHRWRDGASELIREELFKMHGWVAYEYCPECNSFREKKEE